MKYWRGYIVAAVFAALTLGLMAFAKTHTVLVDMLYPYTTRIIQDFLAEWTANADFLVWQLIAVVLGVLALASIVIMIILKWNFFQWMGWVLATASMFYMLHTGLYGLNSYAGPLSDDVRLEIRDDYLVSEIVEATAYFRDVANELAAQIPRDADGNPQYPTFDEMANMAGDGFEALTYDQYMSVFAGSVVPPKELGWADMYSSMGITGFHMSLTGEAAVNPQIPVVSIPHTMCHEMAHRMCIALERDANLAGFLACDANPNVIFRYSAYFMAFRYCYNTLVSLGTTTAYAAAQELRTGISDLLQKDMDDYQAFFDQKRDDTATEIADTVNDTYIKASGDSSGLDSYGQVGNLLVGWYIQEIYMPAHKDEVITFDPMDKNQVDLSHKTAPRGN